MHDGLGEVSDPTEEIAKGTLADDLVRALPVGVIVTTPRDEVALINPEACKLLDVGPDVTGMLVSTAFSQDDIISAITTREEIDEFEVVTGNRHVSVRVRGLFQGRMAILQDVTRFHVADTAKSDFVANVSHELRTPATAIAGYSETLLAEQDSMDPAHASMIETILRNAKRLTALFDDLLLLAKLDAGPAELDLEPLSLEQAIADTIDRVQTKADEKGISINTVVPPGSRVLANRDALRHVLGNLVENGIKYSYDNGVVTIRVRQLEGRMLLEVIDVGIGIGEKHHGRIFERFYRVDKGRARKAGGTGLGLSIVKRLVVAMDGDLELRSRPGMGSVFRVFLGVPRDY